MKKLIYFFNENIKVVMKRIILKYSLTLQQKHVVEVILLVNLIDILEELKEPTNYLYFLVFAALVQIFILLNKNGLLIRNGILYKAKYIFKKYWFKQKVSLKNITDIAILSFKDKQDAYEYQIFLLNSKHTYRYYLTSTKDDLELARLTIRQINTVFNLNNTTYNPRHTRYKKYRGR